MSEFIKKEDLLKWLESAEVYNKPTSTYDEYHQGANMVINELKNRIEDLELDSSIELENDILSKACGDQIKRIETLEKVLEWYADEENYSLENHAWLPISDDAGKRAREAL